MRRQMEIILKQEQRQAMQYGNIKRMSVKEHNERVRFDYNLIDQYIPGNGFKRIYPCDPGQAGLASNGDDLEEFYNKLEKSAATVWKKQVGMVQKKDFNIHEKIISKKKKRKNTKNLLTSMTSHIKKDHPSMLEPEEEAEDDEQELEQVEEESSSKFKNGRRDSAMSVRREPP